MTCLSWIASNLVLASLLAIIACLTQRLGRHAAARILWLLVLVKLMTPPLLRVPIGEASGAVACALGTCRCAPHTATQAMLRETLPWVVLAVWSTGALASGYMAWLRWNRFRNLVASAAPASHEWQQLAVRTALQLGLRHPPQILTVPGRLPPLVVPGWHGPRVLLPGGLLNQLDASQCKALLLHELIHIKRRDHLVRLLELAVSIAYWWLPVVRSFGRQLRACEERSCDIQVVTRCPHARRDYARLLLDVLDFANPPRVLGIPHTTALSPAKDIEQRLRGVMDAGRSSGRGWLASVAAVAVACVILPCQLHYQVRTPQPSAYMTTGCEAAPVLKDSRGQNLTLESTCCP